MDRDLRCCGLTTVALQQLGPQQRNRDNSDSILASPGPGSGGDNGGVEKVIAQLPWSQRRRRTSAASGVPASLTSRATNSTVGALDYEVDLVTSISGPRCDTEASAAWA